MPGLDPGIFFAATKKDRRVKPGDDGLKVGLVPHPCRMPEVIQQPVTLQRHERQEVEP